MVHVEVGNVPEEAKVGHQYMPTFEQEDVVQLEVAVYDTEAMRVGEGAAELAEEWAHIRRAEAMATLEPIAQRAMGHVWRDEIEVAAFLAVGDHGQDVRMIGQLGCHLHDVAEIGLETGMSGELWIDDLHHDLAAARYGCLRAIHL